MGLSVFTHYKCDACGKKDKSEGTYEVPKGWGFINIFGSYDGDVWLCPKCASKMYLVAVKPQVMGSDDGWIDGDSFVLTEGDILAIATGVPIEDVVA